MTRTLMVLAFLLTSCSSSAREQAIVERTSSSSNWSYGSPGPSATLDPGLFEAELHGALVVPPDRALVTLATSVEAPSRAAAAARIRETAVQLAERVASVPGCAVSTWSFGPTSGTGNEHVARATLRLDVDLRELPTPAERHQRLESCLAPYYALTAQEFEDLELSIGEPRLTLDDPGAHRARLLDQRFGALRAVEATSGAPAQFRATALRCTSSGEVRLEDRSLHGIRLGVDFTCAPSTHEPAPQAPSTEHAL